MIPQKVKITPQQNYVLIEINELPSEKVIQLAEGSFQYPYGEVLAVGPDCKFTKVDDKVLFMAGNAIQFNPEGQYFLLVETAIMGKYELGIINA